MFQQVTRNTPDGASFVSPPSLKTVPHQSIYTFDMTVRSFKRYSMNVGVSPIVDYVNFSLSDIPDYTSFTAMFDQYRVVGVTCLFRNAGTQVYTGNSSGDVPYIQTAFDYNDASTAGKPAESYQSCLTSPITASFSRRFAPRMAMPVYNGVSNAYVMGSNQLWLDAAYPSVPHYQLVVNIGATSIDNQFVTALDVLYTVQFKTLMK